MSSKAANMAKRQCPMCKGHRWIRIHGEAALSRGLPEMKACCPQCNMDGAFKTEPGDWSVVPMLGGLNATAVEPSPPIEPGQVRNIRMHLIDSDTGGVIDWEACDRLTRRKLLLRALSVEGAQVITHEHHAGHIIAQVIPGETEVRNEHCEEVWDSVIASLDGAKAVAEKMRGARDLDPDVGQWPPLRPRLGGDA